MRLIILAAGRGTRLRPLTDDRPKALVPLGGRPLLDWQLDAASGAGIDDVVVVGGWRAETLERAHARLIRNPAFATTNMVATLFCARDLFGEAFVVSYGDIVYAPWVLERLLAARHPVSVVVDRDWRAYWERRFEDPLADAESLRVRPDGAIESIGQREASIERIEAQYIGLMAFRGPGVAALIETYEAGVSDERAGRMPFGGARGLAGLYMTDLLQAMVDRGHPVSAVNVDGGWAEIDSPRDLEIAEAFVRDGRLAPVAGAT